MYPQSLKTLSKYSIRSSNLVFFIWRRMYYCHQNKNNPRGKSTLITFSHSLLSPPYFPLQEIFFIFVVVTTSLQHCKHVCITKTIFAIVFLNFRYSLKSVTFSILLKTNQPYRRVSKKPIKKWFISIFSSIIPFKCD